MGAAARAGREAYARACLVNASDRHHASRKSMVGEEGKRSMSGLLIGTGMCADRSVAGRWGGSPQAPFFVQAEGGAAAGET